MKRLIWILLFLMLAVWPGCRTFPEAGHGPVAGSPVVKHKGHGPPPHAPAHGYRHKHQGHTLEYHQREGAYVVVNIPGTYFLDGLYMRLAESGRWYVSATLQGGWRLAAGNEVPQKLKAYKKKSKKQKKPKKKKYKY
ncbi:MAG: hypothetical protein HUN04_10825 [Desulfobacter sp.]|nr:MAG: hypothetical protein HUN04_10825 [Desulfobacter sp.]